MSTPGIDARLLELLQQASNLQLFQLNSVIERMLAQGDCWAISEVKFKFRDINHNEWLGAE